MRPPKPQEGYQAHRGTGVGRPSPGTSIAGYSQEKSVVKGGKDNMTKLDLIRAQE